MKKYIYIQNGKVHEIIPEFDSVFPNVPIEERYAKIILDNCVVVEEGEEPPIGYEYMNGQFVEPAPIIPEEVEVTEEVTE